MVNFNEVKLIYSCPAFPPENVHMDKTYTIGKDNKGFFFTDGIYVEYVKENDLWYIKMLFSPRDKKISWDNVDFSDKVKVIEIVENKK